MQKAVDVFLTSKQAWSNFHTEATNKHKFSLSGATIRGFDIVESLLEMAIESLEKPRSPVSDELIRCAFAHQLMEATKLLVEGAQAANACKQGAPDWVIEWINVFDFGIDAEGLTLLSDGCEAMKGIAKLAVCQTDLLGRLNFGTKEAQALLGYESGIPTWDLLAQISNELLAPVAYTFDIDVAQAKTDHPAQRG